MLSMFQKQKDCPRIGIDLGGTKMEGIVINGRGEILLRKRIPTAQEEGYGAILNKIKALTEELARGTDLRRFKFGIGTPGSVSRKTGLLKNSNTLCLNGKPFQKDLEQKLARKIKIENDANCFALAEALYGAGRGKTLVFGVIMGTGCGGGIVYEGKVLAGHQGIGGEWGHTVIDPLGPACYCGKQGCVETFISGGGLENRYEEKFGERLALSEIVKKFRSQNPQAVSFMESFFKHFGRALANVINILDPDAVILGGGLSQIDELYTLGAARVHEEVFNDEFTTPILKPVLGDSAGVLGAALISI